MKQLHLYTLFLMSVFHSSCEKNQTNVPQDNIKSGRTNYSESQLKEADSSRVPVSMVRNIKRARNGNILIASYLGVFRYDARLNDGVGQGKSLSAGQAGFQHFSTKDGLVSNRVVKIYEDKAGNIWFAT